MPSTSFNWRDHSALAPTKINSKSEKIEETVPNLRARISTLNVRISKSNDAVEKAELADEIQRCHDRIIELENKEGDLDIKQISDAPSVADKKHLDRISQSITTTPMRGQIIGDKNIFVSLL